MIEKLTEVEKLEIRKHFIDVDYRSWVDSLIDEVAEAQLAKAQSLCPKLRTINNLILDFMKPYIDSNVGSIFLSDVDKLSKKIMGVIESEL